MVPEPHTTASSPEDIAEARDLAEAGAGVRRVFGADQGTVEIAPDFDEPLEDFGPYMPESARPTEAEGVAGLHVVEVDQRDGHVRRIAHGSLAECNREYDEQVPHRDKAEARGWLKGEMRLVGPDGRVLRRHP